MAASLPSAVVSRTKASGGLQRRILTVHVALVAAFDLRADFVARDLATLRLHLAKAPVSPRVERGGDEQLHIRIGADHRADIAPVEHCAAGLLREGPLAFEQRRAHLRVDRDTTGKPPDCLAAQFRVGQQTVGEVRRSKSIRLAVGVASCELHLPPDRAVEQAGIEMRQAEMRGYGLGKSALAAGGGSVDGDDHGASCLASQARRIASLSIGRSVKKPCAAPGTTPNSAPGVIAT